MPTVTLEMATLSTEQKRSLAAEVTESVARISGLPADAVYVFIKENNLENVGVGGRLLADKGKSSLKGE